MNFVAKWDKSRFLKKIVKWIINYFLSYRRQTKHYKWGYKIFKEFEANESIFRDQLAVKNHFTSVLKY